MKQKTQFLLLAVAPLLLLIGAMSAWAAPSNGSSNLAVSKSAFPATGPIGTYVNFQVFLFNVGTVDASNIVVQEEPPPGVVITNAVASPGAYNLASGEWTIPLVKAGTSANLTLTALITASGTMTN